MIVDRTFGREPPNFSEFVDFSSCRCGGGAAPGKGRGSCQETGATRGAGSKIWRAYLSTQAEAGEPAIDARNRIGLGPWQNFKGEVVAQNVDDLHNDNNKLSMQTSLTERGAMIPGVGYAPNRHDALTGSQADGRAFSAGEDRTGITRRVAPSERRCLAISIAKARAMIRRRTHGIHPIFHADRTAVAVKPTCAARAVTGCSIALQLSRGELPTPAAPAVSQLAAPHHQVENNSVLWRPSSERHGGMT